MALELLLFILTGVFAGLASGLLGVGGGIVVVPALAFIFNHIGMPQLIIMHMAAGTSLTIMIFTAQASVRAHKRYGRILWPVYWQLLPGIVIGTVGGALLADGLHSHWLRLIFGTFLLIVATRMFFLKQPSSKKILPPRWLNILVSLLIGAKSGLLGVGGGALTVPYLTRCNITIRNAAGISALCSLTIAIIGAMTCIYTGMNEANLPTFSTGYIYWPAVAAVAVPSMLCAPLGAFLSYRLPFNLLKRIFAIFLLLAGIRML